MPENDATHTEPHNVPFHMDQGAPFATSLLLHGILIGIFALIVLPGESNSVVQTIVSNVAIETEQVTLSPAVNTARSSSSDSSGSSEKLFDEVTSFIAHDDLDATPRIADARQLNLSSSDFPAGVLAEQVAPLALHDGTTSGGTGDGNSGSGQGAGENGFFGIDLQAQNVVFVVDASRSMNHPYPGPTKTRFGRVKMELLNTVGKMSERDKFFIVFFNDIAIPMPTDRLTEATTSARSQYLNWMARLKANGKTEPETALLIALSLRPEVIYFLTDGDFDYKVVMTVSEANRSGIAINTIGFGDNEGEKFLKEIAERSNGSYRFIPAPAGTSPVVKEPKPDRKKSIPKPVSLE